MNTPTIKPGNLSGRRWQTPMLHWRPGVVAVGLALAFDPLVVVGVAVLVVAAGLHFPGEANHNPRHTLVGGPQPDPVGD